MNTQRYCDTNEKWLIFTAPAEQVGDRVIEHKSDGL